VRSNLTGTAKGGVVSRSPVGAQPELGYALALRPWPLWTRPVRLHTTRKTAGIGRMDLEGFVLVHDEVCRRQSAEGRAWEASGRIFWETDAGHDPWYNAQRRRIENNYSRRLGQLYHLSGGAQTALLRLPSTLNDHSSIFNIFPHRGDYRWTWPQQRYRKRLVVVHWEGGAGAPGSTGLSLMVVRQPKILPTGTLKSARK
jgi:hypothetical protein